MGSLLTNTFLPVLVLWLIMSGILPSTTQELPCHQAIFGPEP